VRKGRNLFVAGGVLFYRRLSEGPVRTRGTSQPMKKSRHLGPASTTQFCSQPVPATRTLSAAPAFVRYPAHPDSLIAAHLLAVPDDLYLEESGTHLLAAGAETRKSVVQTTGRITHNTSHTAHRVSRGSPTNQTGGDDTEVAGRVASQLLRGRSKFLGYVRKRISDPALAEDIVQDCLLRALRSAPRMGGAEGMIRWFYRVLQNAITDAYRRRAVEKKGAIAYALEVRDSPGPDDERTLCSCLQELIPTLKPDFAEVTRLIDLDGEDPAAVAKRLGISRNNLKVRVHRARQALRRRLEETCRLCAVHHCLDCTCGHRHRTAVTSV
jgi:RNA polymerase sigma-70 factor (ECF subfamily)